MSVLVLSGPEQKEVSTIDKRTDHRKALDRRRFVRDCPSPRPDKRRLVVCSPRSWSKLRELVEVWRKVDFFLSNHRRFRSNFSWARSWAWPSRCTIDFSRKRAQTCKNWRFLPTARITQNLHRTWSMCRDGSLNRRGQSSWPELHKGDIQEKQSISHWRKKCYVDSKVREWSDERLSSSASPSVVIFKAGSVHRWVGFMYRHCSWAFARTTKVDPHQTSTLLKKKKPTKESNSSSSYFFFFILLNS